MKREPKYSLDGPKGEIIKPVAMTDKQWMMQAREQKNLARIYNPHLRPGQRANHRGYWEPRKKWTSKLEEMMNQYNEDHATLTHHSHEDKTDNP